MNLNNSQIHIVEASAGSGKTFALAKRYVQLLLQQPKPGACPGRASLHDPDAREVGGGLRAILAITFANKAVAEMKQRIILFLKKIAFGQLSSVEKELLIKPLGLTDKEASDRAFIIMEEIIRQYNFFQVQTIDSFINALLSGCSFQIGLAANFKIQRNAPEYLERALDELIDQSAQSKQLRDTFSRYLHQFLYIENRSSWFPKKDLLAQMVTLFEQGNTYGLPLKESFLTGDDIAVQKGKLVNLIKDFSEHIPQGVNATFSKAIFKFVAEHEESFDVDHLSTSFAKKEIPYNKNAQPDSHADKVWRKIQSCLTNICEAEAFTIFNSYISVYGMLYEEFLSLSSQDNVLFLSELNKRAQILFDEGLITVEELYYRLATRFRHYMIDEFQDTNPLQWRNLQMMVEEALSSGGTLFYVGDKKQAIYGFRGGDVRLFEGVASQWSDFKIHREKLAINFRSQKAIVEFNNSVFSQDNLSDFLSSFLEKKKNVEWGSQDYSDLIEPFVQSAQDVRPGYDQGYVSVEKLSAANKQELNEEVKDKILTQLPELLKRYAPSDIAFLMRKNKDAENVSAWLMEQGYSVDSERTLNIKMNPRVQEILSFLQFLVSPMDNLSFVYFITGEVFSAITHSDAQVYHDFVFRWRTLAKTDKPEYVSELFKQDFPDQYLQWIKSFVETAGVYPLYEFCVSIYSEFNVYDLFPDDQAFFIHLLDMIKSSEDFYTDIVSFLDYFESLEGPELFVKGVRRDAIAVTTIHKAKGLEFPVVIVPYLTLEAKAGSGGPSEQKYSVFHQSDSLQLIRLKSSYGMFSDKLKRIYDLELKKSLAEDLNNVYVALTRASEELYVYIPPKAGQGENLALYLISDLIPEQPCLAPGAARRSRSCTGLDGVVLKPHRSRQWIEFLQDEFGDDSYQLNDSARFRGELVHAVLAEITNSIPKNLDDVINAALVDFDNVLSEDREWCLDTLKRIVQSELGEQLFTVNEGDVHCEYDIVDSYGQTHRLDRLVVSDNTAMVVDYKSSAVDQEAHVNQVKRYMRVLKGLYPQKIISGCIVYLDSCTNVEVLYE